MSDGRDKFWIVKVDGGKCERLFYPAAVKRFNEALDAKKRVTMRLAK